MLHLAIAPVGLGGHRLEEACAAECGLKAVSLGLADDKGDPGIGMGAEDQVRVVGLDQVQEVGEDSLFGSLQDSSAAAQDLDVRDLPWHGWIAGHLQLQACQRDLKVGGESGFVPISAGEEVVFCQIALILADIHVVEFGLVVGLDFDFLCDFAVGIDPVALQSAIDGSEAALFGFEAAFQGRNHFAVGMRILEVHVK